MQATSCFVVRVLPCDKLYGIATVGQRISTMLRPRWPVNAQGAGCSDADYAVLRGAHLQAAVAEALLGVVVGGRAAAAGGVAVGADAGRPEVDAAHVRRDVEQQDALRVLGQHDGLAVALDLHSNDSSISDMAAVCQPAMRVVCH